MEDSTAGEDTKAWMKEAQNGDPYWLMGALTVLKATSENTNGSFAMIEEMIPAGSSPPLHFHRQNDELFYLLEGVVTFEVDGNRFTATSGSTVYVPHGVHHSYITEEEVRWLIFYSEPGLEQLWATGGRPADEWTIPEDPVTEEDAMKVIERSDQYGIEIVGDPLTPA